MADLFPPPAPPSPSGDSHETGRAGAPAFRRRRLVAIGVAGLLVAGGAIGVGWLVGSGADASGSATSDEVSGATDETVSDTDDAIDDRTFLAGLSPAVAAQIDYVHSHWQDTANDEFGYLEESDCVNFASQSLLERGWEPDDEWWYAAGGDPYAHSTAWISSTAFMEYLDAHPERATALTDDQRDQVKVGDIVQFDWDDSGDRDHTAVVTGVEQLADGSISIEYAGHTDATWDRTVDEAITEIHPGGVAYYWSIPE